VRQCTVSCHDRAPHGSTRRWVSERIRMKTSQRLITVILVLISSAVLAESSLKEMAARASESLARDSSYEMVSVKAFWGDASFLEQCAPKSSPVPASLVIYFEVLPDGRLGQVLIDPLTETAKCVIKHTAHRTFPKPPGKYVTKIDMSFEP
jgi:hypothetical protein